MSSTSSKVESSLTEVIELANSIQSESRIHRPGFEGQSLKAILRGRAGTVIFGAFYGITDNQAKFDKKLKKLIKNKGRIIEAMIAKHYLETYIITGKGIYGSHSSRRRGKNLHRRN